MADSRKGDIDNTAHFCPVHPDILVQVAKLETSVQGVQEQFKETNESFKDMRREISENMLGIRNDITNGILKRYPPTITWIITILSSACTGLLVLYLTSIKNQIP